MTSRRALGTSVSSGSSGSDEGVRVLADWFAGITVDDIEGACKRFEDLQCNWKKRLTDGRMKNVAFLLDPDGYWVEVVQNERFAGKANF